MSLVVTPSLSTCLTLEFMSVAIFLLGLHQVSTGILQGLEHTTIPVVNMIIAAGCKVILNWTLTAQPSLGIMVKRLAYKKENLFNMLNELNNVGDGSYIWPLDGGEISSYFGYRVNPFGGGGDYHPGLDIAENYGTPIKASNSGVVEMADWNGGYGRYVRINHGGGLETAYGHMSAIVAQVGQVVKKGDVIGYVGNSGASTGPHVHFEVLQNGEQVNPLDYAVPRKIK